MGAIGLLDTRIADSALFRNARGARFLKKLSISRKFPEKKIALFGFPKKKMLKAGPVLDSGAAKYLDL